MNIAETLQRTMSDLGAPYGFERSFKLTTKGILSDRFLLTQHKKRFGESPQLILSPLLESLSVPPALKVWLYSELPRAELIHLGFETTQGSTLCKLYLEFPFSGISSPSSASASSPLLYQAAKWSPGMGQGLLTDYHILSFSSLDELKGYLLSCVCGANRVVECLVEALPSSMPVSELMLLDVTEPSNTRHSFDLNLYNLQRPVVQWERLLDSVWRLLGLPIATLNDFVAKYGHEILGHLSGGVSRDNVPFFTLYFGAEEREGDSLNVR